VRSLGHRKPQAIALLTSPYWRQANPNEIRNGTKTGTKNRSDDSEISKFGATKGRQEGDSYRSEIEDP
jgi:hypothetical protein